MDEKQETPKTVAHCVAKLRIDLDRIETQSQDEPAAAARHFLKGHMITLRYDVQQLGAAIEAHGKAAKV